MFAIGVMLLVVQLQSVACLDATRFDPQRRAVSKLRAEDGCWCVLGNVQDRQYRVDPPHTAAALHLSCSTLAANEAYVTRDDHEWLPSFQQPAWPALRP